MQEIKRRQEWWNRQKQQIDGISAYLVTGPDHVLASAFVEECAASLLDVEREALSAHPDFLRIEPIQEKVRMDIKVFRELLISVQKSAQKAKRRVVIVNHIDVLSAQGQNALLKSIEEPRVPTIYFLIAKTSEQVLQTVRSRAIPFTLRFIPHDEWPEKQREFFVTQRPFVQTYLEGRPELVDQMMEGKRGSAKIEKTVDEIEQLLQGSIGMRLAHARVLAKKYDHKALAVFLDNTLLVAHRAGYVPEAQKAIAEAGRFTQRHLNKTFILDHIIFATYENS